VETSRVRRSLWVLTASLEALVQVITLKNANFQLLFDCLFIFVLVLFESSADAQRSVAELNEATFDGRIITVKIDGKV
jgi:hypothetical protein